MPLQVATSKVTSKLASLPTEAASVPVSLSAAASSVGGDAEVASSPFASPHKQPPPGAVTDMDAGQRLFFTTASRNPTKKLLCESANVQSILPYDSQGEPGPSAHALPHGGRGAAHAAAIGQLALATRRTLPRAWCCCTHGRPSMLQAPCSHGSPLPHQSGLVRVCTVDAFRSLAATHPAGLPQGDLVDLWRVVGGRRQVAGGIPGGGLPRAGPQVRLPRLRRRLHPPPAHLPAGQPARHPVRRAAARWLRAAWCVRRQMLTMPAPLLPRHHGSCHIAASACLGMYGEHAHCAALYDFL